MGRPIGFDQVRRTEHRSARNPDHPRDIGPYLKLKTIKYLVLDLSAVSFMSSMGLSMFIGARNAAAAVGAQPVLFGLNKDLKSLMAMMKMDKLFKVVDSQADLNKLLSK